MACIIAAICCESDPGVTRTGPPVNQKKWNLENVKYGSRQMIRHLLAYRSCNKSRSNSQDKQRKSTAIFLE
ncbi:hypothetical protein GCK32_008310 [Trichostrongylus colubriformis]|uniref:Uncharacterized protein n=1 Tax=Trichostrongylus colubriformis TaxID=6319 RepID=A0AAN8FIV5_TRICO